MERECIFWASEYSNSRLFRYTKRGIYTSFNQPCDKGHKIKYKKWCPVEEREVQWSEIKKGYEITKNACGIRTEYTCIKCGYCYSCHWKRERLEEIGLRDNLKDFYVSMSKASNNKDNNQKSREKNNDVAAKDDQVQGLEKWGTLDVLGQPAEPICTYYRCHHKFSLHGTRSCRCKHPINKTLGISVRYH